MKNFLSIGHVAKIKGITPKALRYYEQLGILIPAYINAETGYRYYTSDQLLILDLILICGDFDIPLKQFKNYISKHNTIDMEKLLEDGNRIVEQKIKSLQLKKTYLKDLSQTVNRTGRIKNIKSPFIENFSERYFLTLPTKGNLLNYNEISAQQSTLFFQCRSLNSSDGFNQGILFLTKQGQQAAYTFVQVPKLQSPPQNLYTVPPGKFECEVVTFEQLCDQKDTFSNAIIMELLDLAVSPHQRLFEIQKPIL